MTGPGQSRAFTLIEMLVTISIIAVLAALMIPGVKNVLESSKSTKCVSNLRQLFTASQSWSSENNGRIVPVFMPNDPNNASSLNNWTGLLAPYLGRSQTNAFTSAADLPAAVCPLRPKKFGYGYNYLYLSWIEASPPRNQWATQAGVASTAQTVFLVDSANASNASEAFTNWRAYVRSAKASKWAADYLPAFKHFKNKANVLWLDGHISAETTASDFWKDDKMWGENL